MPSLRSFLLTSSLFRLLLSLLFFVVICVEFYGSKIQGGGDVVSNAPRTPRRRLLCIYLWYFIYIISINVDINVIIIIISSIIIICLLQVSISIYVPPIIGLFKDIVAA